MVNYYFIGTIYEGIVVLIFVPLVSLSLNNHIKVRNKLYSLLFLIVLSYGASIFFSWVSKRGGYQAQSQPEIQFQTNISQRYTV